jgi:RNA polymerase sigma-54 factor
LGSKNQQSQIQIQKLTPQQILQANIMQLNNSLLEQRILKELEDNPILEIVDDEISEDEETDSESSESEFEWDELDADSDRFEYKIDNPDYSTDYLVNNHTSPKTLNDKIKEQLLDINIPEEKMHIANEIIGNLDDDGYFKIEPILVADRLRIDEEEILAMLKIIQSLEPKGIASRDLQECMLLQINKDESPLAFSVITDCFEDFSRKKYEKICDKLGCSLDDLNIANEAIKRLNPKPGDGISIGAKEFVIPDIIVEKRSDEWVVHMNDYSIYELRVNKDYKDILQGKNVDKSAVSFIKNKLLSANWFIDAIRQRKDTMLRVMSMIISKQSNIFRDDKQELIPMVLKDIANELNLDVSTISRATNGKYVQLPWGIFEIKDFFSEAIQTVSGKEVSNTTVKKRIGELIKKEDKSQPIDDQRITDLLVEEGYIIARRTISKYRAMLGIPRSKLRREIG